MTLDIPSLVSILAFYVLITVVGIWAAKATKTRRSEKASDTMIVGGRDIGVPLGVCTMAATWIGGGALNGTAEAVYAQDLGLIWCVGGLSYGVSLVIAGLFFLKPMRENNYITVLDPFEKTHGRYFAAFYFLIEAFGVFIYAGAILNALGSTMEVIAGLNRIPSIVLSAGIATVYTLLGGIYSVAYTDVIQLALMAVGTFLIIPFGVNNEAVTSISDTFIQDDGSGWLGTMDSDRIGAYIDTILLTLLGGVPVQATFQRLLCVNTLRNGRLVSILGALVASSLLIPPVIIGAIGASTNWTLTSYMNGTGVSPADLGNERQILPIVVHYLTPSAVGYIGLGAITAAVMSSADSSLLSCGGEFGRNFYRAVLRPKASEHEVLWSMRVFIVAFGAISTVIAIEAKSIIALYLLTNDLIYVLTWPQFVCSLFLDTNAYGTLFGIVVGIVIRIGGGEYLLGIRSPFNYPKYLPVKTFAMIWTFLSTIAVSWFAKMLFLKGYIPKRYDASKSIFLGAHTGREKGEESAKKRFESVPL